MEKLKPYLVFITIIVVALILGGSYIIVQTNYQKNERAIADQKLAEQKRIEFDRELEESRKQNLYDECVGRAALDYWSYVEINGTKKNDGTIWASNDVWDRANKDKQTAISNCYQQYKK